MSDFSIKNIIWKSTFQVNLIRAGVAAIIWTAIAIFGGISDPWLCLIALPIGYFLIFLPLGIMSIWLNQIGVPWVGLISVFTAILVIPADPIVFLIHKSKPHLLPIKDYNFIEPAIVFWVHDEQK